MPNQEAQLAVVTRADVTDCAQIAGLARAVWGEWANGLPHSRHVIGLGHPMFVAKHEEKVVGYAVGLAAAVRQEAWLTSVTVAPDFRRRGIGTELVRRVSDDFSRAGVPTVVAHVSSRNTAAQDLFRRAGFECTARLPGFFVSSEVVDRFEIHGNVRSVAVCGSMTFSSEMEQLAQGLEARGFTVFLPATEERKVDYQDLPDEELAKAKAAFIRGHLSRIKASGAVLIANFEKNGIPGYVGANTLMEAAFASALDKPLFVLNGVGEQPCRPEVLGMEPVFLNGNLDLLD